jgi:hypothetical protein
MKLAILFANLIQIIFSLDTFWCKKLTLTEFEAILSRFQVLGHILIPLSALAK